MTRRSRTLVISVLLSLSLSGVAFAQTIAGRVVDPDARAVSGADVIVSRGGQIIVAVKSASDGAYGPVALPAGDYEVTAAAHGMRANAQRVSVAPATPATADIHLALSAVQESVVVSDAQVDVPLTRATDAVTVIDRSEIDVQHADTVADLLRLVPGFHVVDSGRRGAVTSIFPRGGESDYTLVLVDGIPQNVFGGEFDAAHLDTADIERIEVVRGPQSALYGNGAIGGIVHVITRQGGSPRAEAAFEGGSQAFGRTTASTSGSRGAWTWGAAFDRLTTDGDRRVFPSIGRAVGNDDYDRVAGSGSIGWSNGAARSFRVDIRGDRSDVGYPGPYGSDPSHLYTGLDLVSRGHNTSREVGASGVFGTPLRGRHRLQVSFADLQMRYVSPPYGCDPTNCALAPDTSDDRTRRVTGRYQYDIDFRRLGVSGGWELLREQVDDTYISGRQFQPIPVTRVVSGLFAEARPLLGDRTFVTAGVRLERIQRSALQGDGYGSRPDLGDSVVWSANPKLAAAFIVGGAGSNGWTKLRAGFGTGIKPPTGFEIAFTDNPDLKPERNRSVDAGVEHAFGPAVAAEASWFYNRYKDLIVLVGSSFAGASRYQTDNIANARSQGVEVGLRWRLASGVAARVAWTSMSTEVLPLDGVPVTGTPYRIGLNRVGDPLVRRPREQGFGELTWTRDRGTAFVTIGGRGRMLDIDPSDFSVTLYNPGYTSVSLGASVTVARDLEIFGRITNALNASFEEAFGYPALGRAATIGVRVRTGKR